jgi:hypothetical protein
MAETVRHTLIKPARLLYSSITQKSAPATCRAPCRNFPRPSGSKRKISTQSLHHGQRDQGRAWFVLGQPGRLLPRGDERRHRRQAGNREGGIGRSRASRPMKRSRSRKRPKSVRSYTRRSPASLPRRRNSISSLPASKPARSSISPTKSTHVPKPARICSIPAPTSSRPWPSRRSVARRSTRRMA